MLRPVKVRSAISTRRSRFEAEREEEARAQRLAFLRDFLALAGLFGTLYGWLVVGSALAA